MRDGHNKARNAHWEHYMLLKCEQDMVSGELGVTASQDWRRLANVELYTVTAGFTE